MFNNSNHSSERSVRQTQRRESSLRGTSSQKSRSAHSSLSSRRSENKSWKIPDWVHCEKCFVTKEDMVLLSCGHIFCTTCCQIENTILPNEPVPCLRCKSSAAYKCLNSSLDVKLHGMFCESWTDPVLNINLRNLQFMMMKSQNYLKFLSKSVQQNESMPKEWVERYNAVKSTMERNQKLQKFQNDLATKWDSIKAQGAKTYKNVQLLTAYARKKKADNQNREQSRQSQSHQTMQGNYDKNLKFISSGRNEHSNQYIGQLKSSQKPNQNLSTINIRNQMMASQSLQRSNITSSQYRLDTSSVNTEPDSRRPQIQTATFRPKTRDNYRFEPPTHGQKRLVASYNNDEYTTPSKRPALYPVRQEPNSDSSIASSGGFSLDLNDSRFNPQTKSIQSTKYSNRHENTRRIPKFK